ncbi:MAG: hypothetical protein R3C15_05720 [Thermoleophilia bacterium]
MRRRLALLAAAAAALLPAGALAAPAPAPSPAPPAAGETAPVQGETAVQLSDEGGSVGTGTIVVLALLLGLFWVMLRRWRPPAGGDPRRRRS